MITRNIFGLATAVLVLAACGLAVSNEDRMVRAGEAMLAGDYRAAVIDTKAVLLDEPENIGARVLLGRASLMAGDAATAEVELKRALQLGGELRAVAVDLGSALLSLQKFDELLETVPENSGASDQDNTNVLILRGRALLGLERPQEARAQFEQSLRERDDNIDAELGIVTSYIQERNLGQARATLDFMLGNRPASPLPLIASGELALMTRNTDRAESDFASAFQVATTQQNEEAILQSLVRLGDVRLVQNKVEAAREVVSQLSELAPGQRETRMLIARLAFVEENWALAQENLQEILRQVPDFRPAQMLLGAVHMQSGNLAQAEMYLSAVVAAGPGNADARQLLAETRYKLNQSDSARETLRPILEANSNTTNPDSLTRAARASLGAGDFEFATEYLQRAVEADPDRIDTQMSLVVAHLMSGKVEEANGILDAMDVGTDEVAELRRDILSVMALVRGGDEAQALVGARSLALRWPESPLVLNLIGALESSAGNYRIARANFEGAAAIAPQNLMSKRYLAAVDVAEGDIAAARLRFREILEARPDDIVSMISLARLAAAEDDYTTTRTWIERAIESDSSSIEPRIYLGRLLLATEDYAAARLTAEEIIAMRDDVDRAHEILGHAALNLDDALAARDAFDRAIEIAPDRIEYRTALARAQAALGNRDAADQTIAAAHDVNPESITVAIQLASLRVNQGDFDEALRIAAQLQQAHPDNAVPLVLESEVMVRQGRLAEAAELYERVIALNSTTQFAVRAFQIRSSAGLPDPLLPLREHLKQRPLDTDARMVLGQALQSSGQNNAAITEYQRVIDIAPQNHVAANNLAWLYFIQNDVRAVDTARTAYRLAPDNGSVIDTLGWILVESGDLAEGVEMLRAAVSRSDGRPQIRYHLAAALVKTGEVAEASTILREIVSGEEAFPGRVEAEQLLRTL